MALTITEEERLIRILDISEEVDLDDWETGFVTDLKERYKELGPRIFISSRMWAQLTKIEERHDSE